MTTIRIVDKRADVKLSGARDGADEVAMGSQGVGEENEVIAIV